MIWKGCTGGQKSVISRILFFWTRSVKHDGYPRPLFEKDKRIFALAFSTYFQNFPQIFVGHDLSKMMVTPDLFEKDKRIQWSRIKWFRWKFIANFHRGRIINYNQTLLSWGGFYFSIMEKIIFQRWRKLFLNKEEIISQQWGWGLSYN